jgi:hypothetical protein
MLTGQYRKQFINPHGLAVLNRAVSIPDIRLGIGDAEKWDSYNMRLEYVLPNVPAVIPDLHTAAMENATFDGDGQAFTAADFPNTGFFGQGLGGF